MVTCRNVSAYVGVIPREGEDRKIGGTRLYPLERVQEIAGASGSILLWTQKCIGNVADLFLDREELASFIKELTEHDYRDSEWCENGKGLWAACDSYVLTRIEHVDYSGKDETFRYFFKFAISRKHNHLLLVSCHLSQ